jgi:hypothetical protein
MTLKRGVSAILIALMALCLFFGCLGTGKTESIPKPSVPEFTVALVSYPYEVAETTQIDPYTGAVSTYPSYVAENRSIEITIKNQPFTSTQMADGNWSRLYYNIRFKGHFYVGDWSYYPVHPNSVGDGGYITASNSDYTIISLPKYLSLEGQPNGSQIDFQVQALIGYDEAIYRIAGNTGELALFGMYFTGEASNWSNTQTITLGDSSSTTTYSSSPLPSSPTSTTSSSQNPTVTPTTQSGDNWTLPQLDLTVLGFAALGVVVVVLLVFLILLRRRIRVLEQKQNGA